MAIYVHAEACPPSSDGCWSQEQRCFRKRRERIRTLTEHVLGTRKLADYWISQRAIGLGHLAPCYVLSSYQGYQQVRDFLARLEYGIYC
ncbi:antitoxin Xre/MbcA/ParS toxin-binding domain-containing protein [Pseudomonas chlororaphis]|uniref:antitoxin Xre/MbcA/ParS toxin-binding domain-containing protein n=1 Tax=Pseudomonas chlororaphis TaxID=587753 RepID=UPI0038577AE7